MAACLKFEWERQLAHDASLDIGHSSTNASPGAMVELGASSIDLQEESVIDELAITYSLVLSIHSKKIFPPRLVRSVRCVNVHPGFNPYNRGWYPQVFSILNGAPSGVTIHEMTDDIDGGPIIAQRQVPQLPSDTSLSLYRRVIQAEKQLIREWLPRIIDGNYETELPEAGNYNSISDFRDLCYLDPASQGSFGDHLRLLRALSHPPFWNAWYLDEHGQKIFVRLETKGEEDSDS